MLTPNQAPKRPLSVVTQLSERNGRAERWQQRICRLKDRKGRTKNYGQASEIILIAVNFM